MTHTSVVVYVILSGLSILFLLWSLNKCNNKDYEPLCLCKGIGGEKIVCNDRDKARKLYIDGKMTEYSDFSFGKKPKWTCGDFSSY